MDSTPTPPTDKQRFWLEHLQACDRSGLTMKAYAQANDLRVSTLYTWKKTLRHKGLMASPHMDEPPLFHKAVVSDSRPGPVRALLPGDTVLEFDAGTDPHWVAQLVRALIA